MKTLALERTDKDGTTTVAVGTDRHALVVQATEIAGQELSGALFFAPNEWFYPPQQHRWCIRPIPWCGPDPLKQVKRVLVDAKAVINTGLNTPGID